MKNRHILFGTTVLVFLLSLVVNFLGGRGILVPNSIASISNQYPSILTPANYTFGIWGILYILAFVCLNIWRKRIYYSDDAFLKNHTAIMLYQFLAITICNVLWIVFWVNSMLVVSLIFILLMAIMLMRANELVEQSPNKMVVVFFQSYYAWILVACCLHVFSILTRYPNIQFFAIATAVVVMLVLFSLLMLLTKHYIWFNIVVLWALGGILSNNNWDRSASMTFDIVLRISIFVMLGSILTYVLKKIRVMKKHHS